MTSVDYSNPYNKTIRGGLKLKKPITTKQQKSTTVYNGTHQLKSNNNVKSEPTVKSESIKPELNVKPESHITLEYTDYKLPDGTIVKQLVSYNNELNKQKQDMLQDKQKVYSTTNNVQPQYKTSSDITKQYIRYGSSTANDATSALDKRSKHKHDKYC